MNVGNFWVFYLISIKVFFCNKAFRMMKSDVLGAVKLKNNYDPSFDDCSENEFVCDKLETLVVQLSLSTLR